MFNIPLSCYGTVKYFSFPLMMEKKHGTFSSELTEIFIKLLFFFLIKIFFSFFSFIISI